MTFLTAGNSSATYFTQTNPVPQVKECEWRGGNAMEMFRHIREDHLTEIKKLKIKIGDKPASPRKGCRPGPRSRTKLLDREIFPFNLLGPSAIKEEIKTEVPEIKKEEEVGQTNSVEATAEETEDAAEEPSVDASTTPDKSEQEGVLGPNKSITLTLKSTGFRIRLSTEAEDETTQGSKNEEEEEEEPAENTSYFPSFEDVPMETATEEEAPIEVDPMTAWHVDGDDATEQENTVDLVPLDTSDPYSLDGEFDDD